MADQGEKEKFVLKLFELQGIKVQDVVLKTGIRSPIYIDLRVIVSHPDLLVRELCLCHLGSSERFVFVFLPSTTLLFAENSGKPYETTARIAGT